MTNVKDTNLYKLFNTKLPAIEHYDNKGELNAVDYYVDINENIRFTFVWETDELLINNVSVGKITEELASELLNIVHSLGYTESH